MNTTQMEIGLENNGNTRVHRHRRRMPSARWWFQQMHTVVDRAFDWSSPEARPQQIYMTLAPNRPAEPEPVLAEYHG